MFVSSSVLFILTIRYGYDLIVLFLSYKYLLMTSRIFALLLLLNVLPFAVCGQIEEDEIPSAYVRIRLNDLTTWEQASSIDQLIRTKPGVLLTRTDQYSDTFLAFYRADGSITVADFEQWITSLGFSALCSVTGLEGEPLKEIPRECGKQTQTPSELEQR